MKSKMSLYINALFLSFGLLTNALAEEKSLPQRIVTIKIFLESELDDTVDQKIMHYYVGEVIKQASRRFEKESGIAFQLLEIEVHDFAKDPDPELLPGEIDEEKVYQELEALAPNEAADILIALTAKIIPRCWYEYEEGARVRKCKHLGGSASRINGSQILLSINRNQLLTYTNIPAADVQLLIHELIHTFGGIHVNDKKSIMHENLLGDDFDETNKKIIMRNRFKHFK